MARQSYDLNHDGCRGQKLRHTTGREGTGWAMGDDKVEGTVAGADGAEGGQNELNPFVSNYETFYYKLGSMEWKILLRRHHHLWKGFRIYRMNGGTSSNCAPAALAKCSFA